MFEVGCSTCNNAFQLVTQQCCVASWRKMLHVLHGLNTYTKVTTRSFQRLSWKTLVPFTETKRIVSACDVVVSTTTKRLVAARETRGPFTEGFSFWCMRFNGLTYECIGPSVQSYIYLNTFVTQPLNGMCQKEKNLHKNHPCKRAFRVLQEQSNQSFDVVLGVNI